LPPTEPLPLHHSWPLYEQTQRFDLGLVLNCAAIDLVEPGKIGELAPHHAACWECDLSNNSLIWSGGVYDIFGLPRGSPVTREQSVTFYSEHSRVAMERLRAHSIRHRRGFTLDAEIEPATGGTRWMRLICAPICEDERVVRLHGLKLII